MKEYFLDLPAITLRATRNADLDYVLAAEDSADNKPFIIPACTLTPAQFQERRTLASAKAVEC